MDKSTNTAAAKSPSISVFRLVLIQSFVTLVGFVLLFGVCTKQVLRYQFSKIDDAQLEQLVSQQQLLAQQQRTFDRESLLQILNRVCGSINCTVEELKSEIADVPPLQSESIRIILDVGLYNIPIFLDVLRAHPYRFSLDGLEVHAATEPVKIQIRLSRTVLPDEIVEPDWVSTLGWNDSELERIRAIYKSWLTNRWSDQFTAEHERASVEWTRLYGTLSRDLWRVHQQNGSLVYTPETGVAVSNAE